MLFKDITLLDENLCIKENSYVGIKDEIIDYIGAEPPTEDYGKEYCGRGKLLMSGFVNAHAHTPMTLLRGYGENLSLSDWLYNRVFPFEAKLNENDIYYGTLLGIAEMLKYGTVSATDMYSFGTRIAEAVLSSGFKCNLSTAIISMEDFVRLDQVKQLYESYHNAGHGRVKIDMSIHAEYTSTPKVVKQMANFTKELGAIMHIHMSETKEEQEGCKERHNGQTPAAYFNSLGLFDNKTIAAHCVWLEGDDFAILKEKGVTVATCPISNLKLASGICNVPKLLENEIAVALGTDSVASNNSLDMLEEMKFFALLHKGVHYDPTLITPQQTIASATSVGMQAQDREKCGKLKKGYKADLVVIDMTGLHVQPQHNLLNNLIYSSRGSDVLLTMVDGKVLYENGEYKTIDIEKAVYEVNQSTDRILMELD